MRTPTATHLLVPIILLAWSSNAAAGRKNSESSGTGSENASIRKGLELRQKGQDEEALKEFRHAYELSKSSRALAQIALAEQALGRWMEAESHLTEALTHTEESWIGRNKKHLDQALNDIQGHLGSLELSGETKEGTVKVDGVQVATLPLKAPLRVPAGSIDLEVEAPGFLPIGRTVVVPARGLAREPLVFVAVAATRPWPPENPAGAAGIVTSQAEKPLARPTTWGTGRTVGVIVGVAALGSLGIGIAYHLQHESRAKSYNSHGCTPASGLPPSDCQSLYSGVNSAEYIAIAGYVGTAVLGGLATYLLVSGPSAPADKVAAADTGFRFQCGPTVGLGVICAGRF